MLPKTEGIVTERLCASIAKIVVYHFLQLEDFIDFLIDDSSSFKTGKNCPIALMILKNIPQEIDHIG